MESFLLTFSGLKDKTEYKSYLLCWASNKQFIPFSSGLLKFLLQQFTVRGSRGGALQATGNDLHAGSHCLQPEVEAFLVKEPELQLS